MFKELFKSNKNYDLEALKNKWQKRLGLSDWEITIRYEDAQILEHNYGRCAYHTNTQKANIWIMNLEDRQDSDSSANDIELDLVHELVHLRLWAFKEKDLSDIEYALREQSVEWLASAMVTAEREGKQIIERIQEKKQDFAKKLYENY